MPRPRQFDADAALEQAIETFWKGGYEATSVDALCEAMAIRPASLYGVFGDKRRLYLAALEAYMARAQAAFAEVTREGGLAGLRAFFARLVNRVATDESGRGCLATNSAAELARRDPEVARMAEEHWARLERLLANLLAQGRQRGELNDRAGPENARVLVCLAQGLNVMAKTRPARESLEALVEAALQPLIACTIPGGHPVADCARENDRV